MIDLETVVELAAVERFLSRALYEAGVWNGPRQSDDLDPTSTQVLEHTAERICIRGRVWEIHDQAKRWFWLELTRSGAWFLDYDVEPRHAKRVGAVERANEVEWRVHLEGDAVMRDGTATPIAARFRATDP